MKTQLQRTTMLLATTAAMLALAACDQSAPPTVGQKIDGAIEQTQQAATEAGQDMKAAANEAQQSAAQAANQVAEGASDVTITTKVKAALAADDQLSALSINVDTTQGAVLLTGPAPTAQAVERATILAKAVDGVAEVKNQLTVTASK